MLRKSLLTGFLIFALASWGMDDARAQASGRMQFRGAPPERMHQLILGNAWTIHADGEIDAGAADRLEKYLWDNRVPLKSYLYLNSPGGNLLGGIKLGTIIRKYSLRTYIGKPAEGLGNHAPGVCYSSCALAFVGGEYRYIADDSAYGVHRFSFVKPSPTDGDAAQIISAAVVQFIRDMDVAPELFSVMTRAGASDILRLSKAELVSLNVVNGGRKKEKWTIESHDAEGIYLKGEQETVYGTNKFMIMCPPDRQLRLMALFDAQNRDEEVLALSHHSLAVNDRLVEITNLLEAKPLINNGQIIALYHLNDTLVRSIASSKTVGVLFRQHEQSPTFAGFQTMPFDEGAKKLPGFLRVCGAR